MGNNVTEQSVVAESAAWWRSPAILATKVFHKRLRPRVNQFTYTVYYLALPEASFATAENAVLRFNRFGLLSYHDRDHGKRDGSDARDWARSLLQECKLDCAADSLIVIAMPRTAGFVFNPVSFWLCMSNEGNINAVIAEVHNTFGEAHSYVLAHANGAAIAADDWLVADKSFHVSPFLTVEGSYRFRFAMKDTLGIWIEYLGADGEATLLTSMHCTPEAYTTENLLKHALSMPFVSLKALILIHWQALKLTAKRIRYHRKPIPPATEYTLWH